MKIDQQISYYAKALYLAVEDAPGREKEIFENLKNALGNKKIKYLGIIMEKFFKLYQKEKRAELILSFDFDEKTKSEIRKGIKSSINGIEEITETVDSDLIAGFRLKTKDVLIKASLKDILTGLKNKTYGHN
ncbi:MAG: F0F1 ATP synthase subunit delta [Candidatus Paceibacterota bacterium]|jgi:F0F1-type ATP synthase delta subunit|nr:F0F1 ATP synthase subunit delta [bacterium]